MGSTLQRLFLFFCGATGGALTAWLTGYSVFETRTSSSLLSVPQPDTASVRVALQSAACGAISGAWVGLSQAKDASIGDALWSSGKRGVWVGVVTAYGGLVVASPSSSTSGGSTSSSSSSSSQQPASSPWDRVTDYVEGFFPRKKERTFFGKLVDETAALFEDVADEVQEIMWRIEARNRLRRMGFI